MVIRFYGRRTLVHSHTYTARRKDDLKKKLDSLINVHQERIFLANISFK